MKKLIAALKATFRAGAMPQGPRLTADDYLRALAAPRQQPEVWQLVHPQLIDQE